MNPLSHGAMDGPKQDTNSPAKQMADKYRKAQAKARQEYDQAVWLYNLESEVHA